MGVTCKVPELRFGEFSGEWKEKEIGKVLTIGSGKDYKHLSDGDIPVYGTGGYMLSVNDFLYDGESVCIGRKGTIDKPIFLTGKFWTVDTLFYTHSFKDSIPKFMYLIFQIINWKKYNEASGVPSLSKATIEKIKILIPSKREQEKIASFLSSVDNRIEQLTKKEQLLREYKKGVMQKIFSQELRFHPKGISSQAQGNDDDGSEFPEWVKKKLGEIAIKKSSNISANKIEDNIGTYIIYGASGVLKLVDFYEEKNDYISIVKDGAGVGRILYCKGKSSVLGTMDIIKPKNNLDTYFLYCLLGNIDFVKYVSGSTIPHIYFKDYSKTICNLPSLKEQTKIANFLSSLDTKIEQVSKELNLTKEFKKALLQQMFV